MKKREFTTNICSHHRSQRISVTCNFCQKDSKKIKYGKVRCSSGCRLIERKLKTYTFEKLNKLANVYIILKRRECYIIDELVQKIEN